MAIGKAYMKCYVAMNSKAIGADITMAWPTAEIGAWDAKMAASDYRDRMRMLLMHAKDYADQNNVTSS